MIAELVSTPSEYIKPDTHCPSIGTEGDNWSKEQCIIRILLDNPCVYGCKVSKQICEERNWTVREQLSKSRKREMMEMRPKPKRKKYVRKIQRKNPKGYRGETWKRFLRHENVWGQEHLWERNRKMFIEILRGMTTNAIADLYELSRPRSSQIVFALCKVIHPELSKELFRDPAGHWRFSILKTRAHGEEFIERLPEQYPKFEESKDVGKTD